MSWRREVLYCSFAFECSASEMCNAVCPLSATETAKSTGALDEVDSPPLHTQLVGDSDYHRLVEDGVPAVRPSVDLELNLNTRGNSTPVDAGHRSLRTPSLSIHPQGLELELTSLSGNSRR